MTHGTKDKSKVDKYGIKTFEKIIMSAISVLNTKNKTKDEREEQINE